MTKEKTKEKARNKSLFNRFLDVVERAGNKLPHPIVLFGLFALGVVVISGLLHAMGVSAEGELINSKTGEVEHTIVTIKSLFNTNGIVYMMTNAVKNFTGFAPLGTVLVAMLGVGVAEQSGWISSLLRKTVEITPAALITPVVVFLDSHRRPDVHGLWPPPHGRPGGSLCRCFRRVLGQPAGGHPGSPAFRDYQ